MFSTLVTFYKVDYISCRATGVFLGWKGFLVVIGSNLAFFGNGNAAFAAWIATGH